MVKSQYVKVDYYIIKLCVSKGTTRVAVEDLIWMRRIFEVVPPNM